MTTDASFDEEAASAWVDQQIERLLPVMTSEASRTWLVAQVKNTIKSEADLDAAVKNALEPDPFYDRAVRQLAVDYLQANTPLPASLRRFVEQALWMEAVPSFPKGRGLDKTVQYAAIRVLVAETMERFGLHRERNEASDKPSACSLVAAALSNRGVKIKEARVEEICRDGVSNIFSDRP